MAHSVDDYYLQEEDKGGEILQVKDEKGKAVLQEDETDHNLNLPRVEDRYSVLREADIRQRIEDSTAQVSNVVVGFVLRNLKNNCRFPELFLKNAEKRKNSVFPEMNKLQLLVFIFHYIIQKLTVVSISKDEASILLLHYKWNVKNVVHALFGDEKEVREKAGLPVKPLIELPDLGDVLCEICLESHPGDGVKSTSCGHPYCNGCWSSYIKKAIADGPGSLLLKCPKPSCSAAVGEDMVGLFATEEEKNKYSGFFVMSYMEENKMMIKWCPGPGCENVINFVGGGDQNFDVSCPCSHSFCWNGTQEAHHPVDCEIAMKWMLKNSLEAENVNCVLAVTRPCPKCKRPIKQDNGCNHMTCAPPCEYEFCWLCLQDWKEHDLECDTRYEIKPDQENSEEGRREKAKQFGKYIHYFEQKELIPFLETLQPREEFIEFREKLSGFTSKTRNTFRHLARVLQVRSKGSSKKPRIMSEAASTSTAVAAAALLELQDSTQT
ncbi:hypothetical protein PTKIN_Ptkin09bG0127000 [Pterospermum kingtungense]